MRSNNRPPLAPSLAYNALQTRPAVPGFVAEAVLFLSNVDTDQDIVPMISAVIRLLGGVADPRRLVQPRVASSTSEASDQHAEDTVLEKFDHLMQFVDPEQLCPDEVAILPDGSAVLVNKRRANYRPAHPGPVVDSHVTGLMGNLWKRLGGYCYPPPSLKPSCDTHQDSMLRFSSYMVPNVANIFGSGRTDRRDESRVSGTDNAQDQGNLLQCSLIYQGEESLHGSDHLEESIPGELVAGRGPRRSDITALSGDPQISPDRANQTIDDLSSFPGTEVVEDKYNVGPTDNCCVSIQGYQWPDLQAYEADVLARKMHLQSQLRLTRQFMLRSAGKDLRKLKSKIWLTLCRTDTEYKLMFRLKYFHKRPQPIYDHFQLKRLTALCSKKPVPSSPDGAGANPENSMGLNGQPDPDEWTQESAATAESVSSSTDVIYLSQSEHMGKMYSIVECYDIQTDDVRPVLGPWCFSHLRSAIESHIGVFPSLSSMSYDSVCIYSLAVSENYIAVSDASSSILLADRTDSSNILCQRVSTQPLQIINCINLLEESCVPGQCGTVGGGGVQLDLVNQELLQLIFDQAEAKGKRLLAGVCSVLEELFKSIQTRVRLASAFRDLRRQGEEATIPRRLMRLRTVIPASLREGSVPILDLHDMGRNDFDANERRGSMLTDTGFSIPRLRRIYDRSRRSNEIQGNETHGIEAQGSEILSSGEDSPPAASGGLQGSQSAGGIHSAGPRPGDSTAEVGYVPAPEPHRLVVLTAGNDRIICEYVLKEARCVNTMHAELERGVFVCKTLSGLVSGFSTCRMSPNGRKTTRHLLLVKSWIFPFCINRVAVHPAGNLMLLVGDNPMVLLSARQSSAALSGNYFTRRGCIKHALYALDCHQDAAFAAAWHPNGYMFATGSDDMTIAIWDLRNLASPICVLHSEVTACRSLEFSPDGKYLVSCESEDAAVIYSVADNFKSAQKIPFFGGCTGASFSEDSKRLIIGVGARDQAGGLIELVINNIPSHVVQFYAR